MVLKRLLSFGILLGFALTLSACGGKDEKSDKGNADGKKEGSGSAKKASEQIIGKWKLDAKQTLAKLEKEAKTEKEKQALEFAKGMMSSMDMTFEFTSDGKMLMSMAAGDKTDTKEGTYKVKSEEAASVIIDGTVDDDTKEVTINLLDGDKIEMIVPEEEDMGSMIMVRVKE